MKLPGWAKLIFILLFVGASVVGFMVKLPSAFRGSDKEMHTAFYFAAAAFVNLVLANRNIIIHAVIFIALYLFGVVIEHAQEYSNKFSRRKIHGRYDPVDVEANLKGLLLFTVVWLLTVGILFALKKQKPARAGSPGE